MPSLFTVPIEKPLLEIVARRALALADEDNPLKLADSLVLLPNRRSCLAITRLFGALAEGRTLFLPRIRPIGEPDELELMADGLAHHPDWVNRLHAIPPAMSASGRLLAVTRHLWEKREGLPVTLHHMEQAARLAGELIACMDELDREQVDYGQLLELPSEVYAQHWQQSVELLTHLLRWWPDYAREHRIVSPLVRRNALLNLLGEFWTAHPPDFPVIAAGSTGTHPATADLLGVISRLPHGEVIVPGLDVVCDESVWEAVDPTHPQYQLKRLLERLGAARRDVALLDDTAVMPMHPHAGQRARDLLDACCPAECTDGWHERAGGSVPVFERIDCAHEREEAEVIALLLRETAQAGGSAALITHDQTLMRRVTSVLAHQGIAADSAVGQPASGMPLIGWLTLVVQAAIETDNPLSLLALLKHPCFAEAESRDELGNIIERRMARGLRRRSGWLGRLEWLIGHELPDNALAKCLFNEMSALSVDLAGRPQAANALFDQHVQTARALSPSADWNAPDLTLMLAEIEQAMASLGDIDPAHYPGLLQHCLAGMKYFPEGAGGAGIHLLTPIEARLQRYDRVVLSGLNEQSWPRHLQEDHWLNPGIRNALGLPDAQASIGLEAHDFILAACSGECFVTRARRQGGAETLPSRWLERLDAMRGVTNVQRARYTQHYSLHWLHAMQWVEPAPILPPAGANPPLSARPSRLSVTQVETWLRDPYSIYARHVLKLEPLDPIDESPDAALRGSVMHKILEKFVRAVNDDAAALTQQTFGDCAREVLRDYDDWPLVTLLWVPRIERMAGWFVALERERREKAVRVLPEHRAEAAFGRLQVHVRIDRVEMDLSGAATIIDYKTGEPPTRNVVEEGYGCQLPLSALLLPEVTAGMEYWRLGSGLSAPEVKPMNAETETLTAFYREGMLRMAQRYLGEGQPYYPVPVPARAPSFNNYAHLARLEQ